MNEIETHPAAEALLTVAQARAMTDKAQADLGSLAATLADLYRGRAWLALGYQSWAEYTDAELSLSQWRLPKGADRDKVLITLRDSGMSLREIESATGLGKSTVHRMLGGGTVPNGTAVEVARGLYRSADGTYSVRIPATLDELKAQLS